MCIRDRVILTTGLLMTVIDVGKEVQKVVDEVNVTLAVPTDIPVIKPLLFIVAIAGLKLVHVPLPPVVLVAFDVNPTQIGFGDAAVISGLACTVIVRDP